MKRRKVKKSKKFEKLVLSFKHYPSITNPWALAHWVITHRSSHRK